ncbi:acyl-CoA dehydrogenase [Croceicoccus bisphenolivorans]|uniref:acyl-CoA dehydrogenase n=1 Tax=Croceicoccus bisphenolivorans TaxID=1783232 RepID=UPI00082E60EC|nr:acyl-CoA dehydrogenase [Croceicoccus bisphenolivorans]
MIIDSRDIQFLLRWLDLGALLERPEYAGHTEEEVAAVLELAERLGERELAPHLRAADTREPSLLPNGDVTVLPEIADAVRLIAEAGLFSTAFEEDMGGLQLPYLVHFTALGILMSGNLSAASFPLLTVANARVLASYGSEAQRKTFGEPQVAGTWMGSMCLSEPHAGSSLGDIRTKAQFEGEDEFGPRYRISGNKMWISAGDHDVTENVVHLVLAKTLGDDGQPLAGTKGISLFVVPKTLPDGERNDVTVAGLNHKLGWRGLPNCALNFGEGRYTPGGAPGAIGWRIGEIGQGLPQMFQMMNDARTSVGLAGSMLACRGYQMSLDYARERKQGRHVGTPSETQVPIIEHADVKRMLLTQKAISQGALGLVLYSARLLDEEHSAPTEEARREAGALLALLTPATKTWPSEWGQVALDTAIQIHGGSGYTRDFEVELLYRDNRLNPIHEGTTGIQGIDLVGRKLRRENGETFRKLAVLIRETTEEVAADSRLRPAADAVDAALGQVEAAVDVLLAEPDDRRALAHATSFLFAFGHLVVGWLWLKQAQEAEARLATPDEGTDVPFLEGRITTCLFFAEAELPKVAGWLQPLMKGSNLVLEMPLDQF